MQQFELSVLREWRLVKGASLEQLAREMGVSAAQVQRLEAGKRRLTVDMLLRYCDALGVDANWLFQKRVMAPIIGVINAVSEVLPLTPNTPHETPAPNFAPLQGKLAAIRWEAEGRIGRMNGQHMFFRSDVTGIPPQAWNQRCIIRRRNGTQRIGWPLLANDQVHIDDTYGDVEFNAEIVWASPILAVVSPLMLAAYGNLGKPD